MLDLRRLTLLHQFSLRGSIAATAEALGFSPSAVSQQLAVLERELGVELLERTPRSARLTPAGRLLVERAGPVLTAAEALKSDVLALGAKAAGPVTMGVIPSVAAPVAGRVAEVAGANPEIAMTLHEAETAHAVALLERGDLDIAIIDEWPGVSVDTFDGLRRHEIACDPLVLAVPAGEGFAPEGTLTAVQLRGLVRGKTWLCAPAGHPSRDHTDQLLRRAAIETSGPWEFEGLLTIATLVADGTGVAVLPRSTLRFVQGRVDGHPLGGARRLHAAVLTSHERRPAIAAVLESLLAEPPI